MAILSMLPGGGGQGLSEYKTIFNGSSFTLPTGVTVDRGSTTISGGYLILDNRQRFTIRGFQKQTVLVFSCYNGSNNTTQVISYTSTGSAGTPSAINYGSGQAYNIFATVVEAGGYVTVTSSSGTQNIYQIDMIEVA